MADSPWVSIIGLGEDGLDGLSPASLAALNAAKIVMGPPRHLSLLPDGPCERIEWPVPFADGVPKLLGLRGQPVAVLVSGDPFWYGAGTVLARELKPGEWRAFPAPSTFAHVAAHMGWAIDQTVCLGLHAAPVSRLRPHLAAGKRIIVLLRDGAAVSELARYLADTGFESSKMTVCEAIAGPNEKVTSVSVAEAVEGAFSHPVAVALDVSGEGASVPLASGRPDALFDHDGQITKRPVRALTLSALAPQPGEYLWDIGGGSGSIAIEWLLSGPTLRATSIEADPIRAARIEANARTLGVDRLEVVQGWAPAVLSGLAKPDAVFVGGGINSEMLDHLVGLGPSTRLVANAVTLEAESLLSTAQSRLGGTLTRIEISEASPLGGKRGWRASFPIVQWSVLL